jgi:hypothetical protein
MGREDTEDHEVRVMFHYMSFLQTDQIDVFMFCIICFGGDQNLHVILARVHVCSHTQRNHHYRDKTSLTVVVTKSCVSGVCFRIVVYPPRSTLPDSQGLPIRLTL